MKIGTDINLSTCRAEGYLMMEFNKNKLIKKGKLVQDCDVNFKATLGYLSHDENGKPLYPSESNNYQLNVSMCWNDVCEIYKDKKAAIDSFAETDKHINFDNPTEYDLLNLASDVNSYCGLE